MWFLFINSICEFFSKHFFTLRLQIYIVATKKIVSWVSITECVFRQFGKSYLPGLYKIPVRIGLDLVRKRSIKIVLMQKLGFQLYEIEFFTKEATPPPLRDWSDLNRSYPSISII